MKHSQIDRETSPLSSALRNSSHLVEYQCYSNFGADVDDLL